MCCKEVQPNKSKDKKDKTKSNIPKIRNKNNKLQLKGRIFMTNVTEVLSFAKPGKRNPPYTSFSLLTAVRLVYCTDLVERGPWSGELHH